MDTRMLEVQKKRVGDLFTSARGAIPTNYRDDS
jgi:hypothetical protein